MTVDWVSNVSWGPITNPGPLQTHYWQIPFTGTPHVIATAYLCQVSIGEQGGTAGVATAAFKRFQFLDSAGVLVENDLTSIMSNIEVVNCVSITVALDVVAATACGGWSFYGVSP